MNCENKDDKKIIKKIFKNFQLKLQDKASLKNCINNTNIHNSPLPPPTPITPHNPTCHLTSPTSHLEQPGEHRVPVWHELTLVLA